MPLEDMDQYHKAWWTYNLNIVTDRGDLKLKWSEINEFAKWSNIQAGLYVRGTESSLQLFYEHFPRWQQFWWDRRASQGLWGSMHDSGGDNPTIVDIGCGLSVQDLLLAKYFPGSTFTLVDKEGFEFRPGIYYDKDYPEYNSWKPVVDGIESSGLDPKRFSMQGPEDKWPDQVDAVTSYLSYCWHYPKELYWQKVMDHLKVGGVFCADVRILEDRDVMAEISEDMKSDPISKVEFGQLPKHVDAKPSPNPDIYGYSAVWVRRA